MRSLESTQEERSKAARLTPIPLLVITTYSDRDAGTPADIFYISDRSLEYDWKNAGTDRHFLPWLLVPVDLEIATAHIPDPTQAFLLQQSFSFALSNRFWPEETSGTEGERVRELLRETYPLEKATVEFAQLLVDPLAGSGPLDLTAYAGNEHPYIYRGRIRRVGPTTADSIQIECVKDSPEIKWTRADDATKADPRDLGVRYPKPYGQVKKMPLPAQEVGWMTTLAEPITASQTGTIDFTDLTGIADSSGSGRIASEEIAWTGKSGNSLTGVTRGQSSTNEAAHKAGEVLVELIATATFQVSDGEVDAIDAVYALNPYNGELALINVANYTKTLTSPAKITMDTADMRAALADLAASAEVTQQPIESAPSTRQQPIAVTGGTDANEKFAAMDGLNGVSGPDGTEAPRITVLDDTDFECDFRSPGTFTGQTARIWIAADSGSGDVSVYAGTSGGTLIGTIDSGDIPAANTPELFEFFTTETDNKITVRPLGTLHLDIYEVERLVNVSVSSVSQLASSASKSGSGCSGVADAVRDGNTESGVTLISDSGWIQAVFPSVTGMVGQRIHIWIDAVAGHPDLKFNVSVGGTAQFGTDFTPDQLPPDTETFELIVESDETSDTIQVDHNRVTLGDFEVREIQREAFTSGLYQDAEIAAASMGFGLRLFADVDGAVVPVPATEWDEVYDLDDDSGWSVTPSVTRTTDSGEKYPGSTASQKLECAFTVQIQCEIADTSEAAQWNAGANASVADEGTIITEGSGSIKGASTSSSAVADIEFTRASPVDLTAPTIVVVLDVRLDKQGASGGEVQVRIGSDASNYRRFDFAVSSFSDNTWHTLACKHDQFYAHEEGSPDFNNWDYIHIQWNDGGTQVVGFLCYVDNIRTMERDCRAQRNSISPTLDMQSDTDEWRFAMRMNAGARSIVDDVMVYLSNSSASGTSRPISYSSCRWEDTEGFPAADTWGVLADLFCTAAGDTDAVQTIQLQLNLTENQVMDVITGPLIVYIDTIQAQNYVADNYDAAAGALIEKPTDIFVHWCEEIGGVSVDTVSLATALVNLGADKLAFDMRGLTAGSWKDGLAAIAFHARANVVASEATAGTVYKFLTAESDYEWRVEDRTIKKWMEFTEESVNDREIHTRWTAFYSYNPVHGASTDENYAGFLRADEDTNDLSDPSTGEIEAAVDKYGNSEAPPLFFLGIEDEATAKDIFGYYVHEGIRAPRIFYFAGCPWWEVYDLETGDIVNFTHPWSDATVKARVISYVKKFGSEFNDLRCLEVS